MAPPPWRWPSGPPRWRGGAKEGIDVLGYGRVEWMDFVFTAMGALPVAALWLALG